jgi:hypothetical protein
MKHTRDLDRIATSLENIEKTLGRLAAVAERTEYTINIPVRIARRVLTGR